MEEQKFAVLTKTIDEGPDQFRIIADNKWSVIKIQKAKRFSLLKRWLTGNEWDYVTVLECHSRLLSEAIELYEESLKIKKS